MIALVHLYAARFDEINSVHPTVRLLDLPVWKFCAVVEGWFFAHTDPDKHGDLEQTLTRGVHFRWLDEYAQGVRRLNPLQWQENKPGESLLSAHRGKRKDGDG